MFRPSSHPLDIQPTGRRERSSNRDHGSCCCSVSLRALAAMVRCLGRGAWKLANLGTDLRKAHPSRKKRGARRYMRLKERRPSGHLVHGVGLARYPGRGASSALQADCRANAPGGQSDHVIRIFGSAVSVSVRFLRAELCNTCGLYHDHRRACDGCESKGGCKRASR